MPAYLAKALSLGKRSTLAASEINLAAVNSAHPGSVGRVDPRSFTRRTIRAVSASMFSLNTGTDRPLLRLPARPATRTVLQDNRRGLLAARHAAASWVPGGPDQFDVTAKTGDSSPPLAGRPSLRVDRRSFSSHDTGSWKATGKVGSRSTARATASASMGSDLPHSRADARLRAIKCGGHRFTGHGPPASKSRSSRPVTYRLSSRPR
jgi:hypothetical protein